jgi:hypothetical protein
LERNRESREPLAEQIKFPKSLRTLVFSVKLENFSGHGGEGGILSEHPKKFPVAMVKLKSFVVNEQIVEKPFCQCHWEI